jgi:hypothetical protein
MADRRAVLITGAASNLGAPRGGPGDPLLRWDLEHTRRLVGYAPQDDVTRA